MFHVKQIGKPRAGRGNSPPPLGEVACHRQAGEGERSFSRPQLRPIRAAFHVKQTGHPTAGWRNSPPPLGKVACPWQAGEGKRSFHPQLRASQAAFHVKQTGKPTARRGNSPPPLGEVACHRQAGEGRNLPTWIYRPICRKRQIFFRFPRAALPFRPALWYNVQRTQRVRHSLCGRIASPGSERTGVARVIDTDRTRHGREG